MTLKDRLTRKPIVLTPGVYDGLTATIAEQAGAETLYLSGAGIAYTRFGRPDIGLVSMAEVADTVGVVRDRTALPLIVDADTGFGNALNVQRTVRVFERAGATAVQIEDQSMPKRCGHLSGKQVIPCSEMVGKLKAALDARVSDQFLIIARTDALAVEGFPAALDRATAYVEAGADMIFLDALTSEDQMRTAVDTLSGQVPVMANMVEGGRTPLKSAADLQQMGFALVIFPAGIVRALAAQARDFYTSLVAEGTTAAFADRMLDFEGLGQIVGTDEILAVGARYDGDAT
ncbi:MAG: isocitrate lyase/phosphoenolpyruvate mutase family protein [Pseudomonadota bacterium]